MNSIFTLGLVIGISVGDTTLGTTVANLGMTDVRFPKPVFHGDTVHARTTVVSLRRSRSRADAGIVEFEHVGLNQRGDTGGAAELMIRLARLVGEAQLVPLSTQRYYAVDFSSVRPVVDGAADTDSDDARVRTART